MLIYADFSKNSHVVFKFFFLLLLLFWKFWSYLVCAPSFKPVNSSSLSRKNCDGMMGLRGKNTLLVIGLIELTESSDTLIYKPCLKITFYRLFYTYFYYVYLCGTNAWTVFYIFLIWFRVAFGVTVLKALCFWCSSYKVIWN